MRFGEKARIMYNNGRDALHQLQGYRGMLDYYALDTSVVRVEVEDKLKRALLDDAEYAITLLLCHGWGRTDDEAVISWTIQRQVNEIEWEPAELHLTKENIADFVTTGNGILVNLACWSAKVVWADTFLNAGFHWYIAPEKTSDMFSAYQFVGHFSVTSYTRRGTLASGLSACLRPSRWHERSTISAMGLPGSECTEGTWNTTLPRLPSRRASGLPRGVRCTMASPT